MNQADAVTTLAEKAWAHRKQFGYLKSLSKEPVAKPRIQANLIF